MAGDFPWLLGVVGRRDAARGKLMDTGHSASRLWYWLTGFESHRCPQLTPLGSRLMKSSFCLSPVHSRLEEIKDKVATDILGMVDFTCFQCCFVIRSLSYISAQLLNRQVEHCKHFILSKHHTEAVIVPYSDIFWVRIPLTESHFESLILCPEQFCVFSSGCCALK